MVGDGPEASVGDRVVVHYDLKFRNVTFMTSRQGMGVTGGTPFGWDVGQPAGSAGSTLKGLDVVRTRCSPWGGAGPTQRGKRR